jgi:hypothetical protein
MSNESDSDELPPTTHYVFESSDDDQAIITRWPRLKPPFDNWIGGKRWKQKVPTNLVAEIHEGDEGTMIPFFDGGLPLMTPTLLAALREAGVDNLDDYPAMIREIATGRDYPYRAVNIIGTVRAADLAGSDVKASAFDDEGDEFLIDAFFRRFKLNEAAAEGFLFFRLAEKLSAIFVHRSVRDHLERSGIEHLSFIHPTEWSG